MLYTISMKQSVWPESLERKISSLEAGANYSVQTLPVTDKVYLSIVHADFDGETFYPELPKEEFVEKARKEIDASIPYAFVEFERVKGK